MKKALSNAHSSHRKVDTATNDNHLEYRQRLKNTIWLIFEGMQNLKTSMDNIVIWGSYTKSHQVTVKKIFDIYKSNNVTLNREKCLIAVEE